MFALFGIFWLAFLAHSGKHFWSFLVCNFFFKCFLAPVGAFCLGNFCLEHFGAFLLDYVLLSGRHFLPLLAWHKKVQESTRKWQKVPESIKKEPESKRTPEKVPKSNRKYQKVPLSSRQKSSRKYLEYQKNTRKYH